MSIDNTDGLSFSDAAAETLAELESANSDLDLAGLEAEETQPEVTEQPPVNETENEGVFESLYDEPITEGDEQLASPDSLVEVNGRQITVDELRQGYMRQEDYTRKTQETADTKREYQNAITLWESMNEDPEGTLNKLNRTYGIKPYGTQNFGTKPEVPSTQTNVDIDELVEQKIQERLGNDPNIQQLRDSAARDAINREFDKIEKAENVKLTDRDRALILKKAHETGSTDFGFIFSALRYQEEKIKAERANARNVSSPDGRGYVDSDGSTIPEFADTFAEAAELAMRELQTS